MGVLGAMLHRVTLTPGFHHAVMVTMPVADLAARMQAMGLPNVWFYENLEGGHGAGADNKQAAYMHALAYGFLWDQLK